MNCLKLINLGLLILFLCQVLITNALPRKTASGDEHEFGPSVVKDLRGYGTKGSQKLIDTENESDDDDTKWLEADDDDTENDDDQEIKNSGRRFMKPSVFVSDWQTDMNQRLVNQKLMESKPWKRDEPCWDFPFCG
ncbi:hypothetical protein ACKWTF_014354 [Chironomus riparius]